MIFKGFEEACSCCCGETLDGNRRNGSKFLNWKNCLTIFTRQKLIMKVTMAEMWKKCSLDRSSLRLSESLLKLNLVWRTIHILSLIHSLHCTLLLFAVPLRADSWAAVEVRILPSEESLKGHAVILCFHWHAFVCRGVLSLVVWHSVHMCTGFGVS